MVKSSSRALLTATALIELGAGLALLALPSLSATLLVGAPLDTPIGLVVARMAGVALLSLGIACWLARDDAASRSVRALVAAMLFYNVGVAAVLLHARMGFGLDGVGVWPVVFLHAALAIWCVICLRNTRAGPASG